MNQHEAIDRFLDRARAAFNDGALVKLTLGSPTATGDAARNVFIRPVALQAGLQLSFVFRHATRDITKNFPPDEGFAEISRLLAAEFRTANLIGTQANVQFARDADGSVRLKTCKPTHAAPAPAAHDRAKGREIEAAAPWLHALGVTTRDGKVAKGMEAKFRQIHRFIELLEPLVKEAFGAAPRALSVADMGCGKGYLTFAAFDFLRRAGVGELRVHGIEARADLAQLCNRVAKENNFAGLEFSAGAIADAPIAQSDALIALHACDTATDDALARGIESGARLLVCSPCCHKELRPQLRAPAALAEALRHGIFREREAEFVTDALRAALLEWAGYDTRVFEFISPEHTGKNLMIAAVKRAQRGDEAELARRVRELAAFYGIREQRLAARLNFNFVAST
ncbi:MAG: SAM-dependent methyltransferase [Verrucomicrobia bacterium]|nr:SAM-dependent methyltransferase [Verrucomicrobiota bacterium]